MPARWTLENALPIISAMDPIAKSCNFYLALRGGVLTRGESDSDLDLCFLCKETEDSAFCSVERLLGEIKEGMREQIDHCDPPTLGPKYPRTFIWLRDGRRIDAQFWLSEENARLFSMENRGRLT